MRWDPESTMSESYNLKISMLKNGKPEELLKIMKNFKTAIDRKGSATVTRIIKYLCTPLSGEDIK